MEWTVDNWTVVMEIFLGIITAMIAGGLFKWIHEYFKGIE